MKVEEFFDQISKLAEGNSDAVLYDNQSWEEAAKAKNERIAEKSDFINEATADWTAEDWKKLFEIQINYGDPEIYNFAAKKLNELTDGMFLRDNIKNNSEILKQNVYFCTDKEALYKSDILHASVKALNGIACGTANDEVLEAFKVCANENEHILYDLAQYIAMQCTENACEFINDEAIDGEKLIAIVSMCVQYCGGNENIFKAMKQRFKKLDDNSEVKDIFAALFGDYGDPNAIMILRKFAKSLIAVYNETHDRELFSRIMMVMSVIEGLGGITDDLMQ